MNPNSLLDKLGGIVTGLPFMPKIQKYLFVGPVLAKYDGGKLFREVVATLMKLACIGVALGGLRMELLFIELLGDQPLPSLLLMLWTIIVCYSTIHVLWTRANMIYNQPDSEINITPILVVLIRTVGEVISFVYYTTAVFGFVICIIGGADGGTPIPMEKGFEGAIYVLGFGLIGGFIATLAAYFWAEAINIAVTIARNTEIMAKSASKSE